MSQSINNPDIPFLSAINNGLSPGKLIRIQGSTPPTATRFNINLQCGPNVSPRDDLALHLSIRLTEGYAARNTLINQMWGEEHGQGFNPIAQGQQFEILILADQTDYKIAINGKHFCEFPHRIPINRVTHIAVDGEVLIKLIHFEMAAPPMETPPQTGPLPGYGAPPMYGPPNQPPVGPYGQPPYGGQMGPGPYGPYGPPPPPGHNPDADKSGSGIEGFLGQAGAAIAGAFGSAVLQGALSGKQGQNNPNQPQSLPPQPQQQQPFAGGYGGQSVGGLGSIGSFLTSTLADTILKPSQKKKHKKQKKAAKKALKYGLVGAGLGFGAYTVGKGLKHHHGHRFKSSSSSSSSSSDSS